MFATTLNTSGSTTTSWKVVLPFYGYAAIAFFVAHILLLLSAADLLPHYFHPHTLAITHLMALGWGTMIILGASHQLVPVLIESRLYSHSLAWLSFVLAAIGIPLLVYGFYTFHMGWPAQWGGSLVIIAIISYLVNLAGSMVKSKQESVHAFSIFTSVLWLLATAVVGLLLVFNFTYNVMPKSSLDYLPLHAHIGIVGWFLLLITGIGSRLIPMFLLSKYHNLHQLWWIYGLINGGLLAFVFIFFYSSQPLLLMIPVVAIAGAILLFVHFCYRCYQQRIRKKVDEPMGVSLISVMMMLLPLVFLFVIIILMLMSEEANNRFYIAYGFIIFFGWITAIILGMTFKTLPFIIWNKVYHHLAGKVKTPGPKDLFSTVVFKWMALFYVIGFVLFTAGILMGYTLLMQVAALVLLFSSLLYNWNVVKLIMHQHRPT